MAPARLASAGVSDSAAWIRTTGELTAAAAAMPPGPVAMDLEADSFHHYKARVCLLQFSFGDREVLVDPLADLDPAPLRPVLGDPAIRKLLHGADYDLRLLHSDLGLEVRGLFDTMVAARLTGERAFGLGALVEAHLGARLDKRHQRADWSLRPLSPERAAYAAEDVRHLRVLAERLEARLRELGRSAWAEEEFRRIEALRWADEPPDPEAYRKIKGASDLDGRALAALREIHRLRDDEARERNVPPFRVARDEALLEILRAAPRARGDLDRIPHLSWRLRRGPGADALLAALERARALPDSELPERSTRVRRRPDRAFESRVRELQERRDALAHQLDLEPSVLAPRGVLESLLECLDEGRDPREARGLRAWQADLLLPMLHGAGRAR
jgi:ribonuclease D